MTPHIRPAQPADAAVVFQLVSELAAYERLSSDVDATPEMLGEALFGETPKVFADIAEFRGEIALRPSRAAEQKPSTPQPVGNTQPLPAIATRTVASVIVHAPDICQGPARY